MYKQSLRYQSMDVRVDFYFVFFGFDTYFDDLYILKF